jgi:CO/xanthine dehydrogenase Mo-binding subunit
MEHVVYGSDGQLMTGSLLDYAVPRADTIPQLGLTRTETLTPRNLLGAQRCGRIRDRWHASRDRQRGAGRAATYRHTRSGLTDYRGASVAVAPETAT